MSAAQMVAGPIARQVYKRIMWAARDYPGGPERIRTQAKAAIRKHQHETDPSKLRELMARVDYIVGEIDATCSFHKYRHLRRNYTVEDERIFKELQKVDQAATPGFLLKQE